jgi:hypothetical protein
LYSHSRAIISDCTEPLAVEWKLSEPQIGKVRQVFESVVGGTGSHPPIPPAPVPTSPPRPEEDTFAQSLHLLLAAIAQGLPAVGAMEAFGTLGRGSFSHDNKCSYPESAALSPIANRISLLSTARRLVVSGCEGEGDTTIFLLAGAVAAIVSDKAPRSLGGRSSPPEGGSRGGRYGISHPKSDISHLCDIGCDMGSRECDVPCDLNAS